MGAASALVAAPVTIGPTWSRNERGRFRLPPRTLGWAIEEWTSEYLRQPDGPEAGEPWRFTDEQMRFLLWWYALDERGRFVFRRGMLRRMKGWGKDPFAAALCCVEFVGPCRFGGWSSSGEPIAVDHPAAWVQTAAVSKDQTRNTTSLLPAMLSPEAIAEYGIDVGKELLYAEGGRKRLEAVTSSPRALEGGRPTALLKNEPHHWLKTNDGHEMAKVMARNAAKSRDGQTRVLNISNAHNPAEDSDAQKTWEAWEKIAAGSSRGRGLMYDSVEAPPDTCWDDPGDPCRVVHDGDRLCAGTLQERPDARLVCGTCGAVAGTGLSAALRGVRGDSAWVDVERLKEEIYDPETEPSTARRFYLNQLVAAEDAWVAPHEWDRLADPGRAVLDGEQITLRFDGSKTNDHCAVVGCRISDGHLFTIGHWDPGDTGGEIPLEVVDGVVRNALGRFDVVAFFSDYHPFESYVDAWARDFGAQMCVKASGRHAIAWDMRGRQKEATVAAEALHSGIVEGDLTWDGHPVARQHVHNARRRPNQWGVTFGKEQRESSRKVDWTAAAMLARLAKQQYDALAANRKRRQRTGKAVFV